MRWIVRSLLKEMGCLNSDEAEAGWPRVKPEGRSDVVANRTKVDEMLASLGFRTHKQTFEAPAFAPAPMGSAA